MKNRSRRTMAWRVALGASLLLVACAPEIEPVSRDPGGGSSSGGGSSGGGRGSSSGGGASSSGGGSSSNGGGSSSSGGASSSSGGASSSSGGASSSSGGGSSSSGGQVIGHPRHVLLTDEGNRRILRVDLQNPGTAVWSRSLDGPRDFQLVGGDRVAVSTATGYVELDVRTGEVKKTYAGGASVETLRRFSNGHTILGANGGGGVTLLELDAQDAPVPGRRVTFTSYGQLRLLRRTPQGTFLAGVGTKLVEVDWSNRSLWEMDIPDGSSVYQGLHLADGTIAVTSGYGAAILIVDPATKQVRATIGGKGQPDAASVLPNFFAGFQILPNGHFVVTNWEGHGAGNGGRGLQLLEYDPSGRLTWTWRQDPSLVSSLHNVIVLDGLDTTRLHDDVDGVLAPVGP